jgi:hypothetical protein
MSRSLNRPGLPLLALLALAFSAAPAYAESYTVSWNPVTAYSDGAPLEAGKTVAYSVYWTTDPSLSAGTLKPVASSTSAVSATFDPTTAGMTRGKAVYFTMKSVLGTGKESPLSPAYSWTVPKKAPGSPGGTKIIRL